VDVYRITGDKLRKIPGVNETVQRDFEHRHRCFDDRSGMGNDPNVAGLKWVDNRDRLIIVAEVPPISLCKDMEYFAGYEILLSSRRIVGRFSPQQLADRWGEVLGERLRSNLQFLSADAKARVP
jgi:hypothetical protein